MGDLSSISGLERLPGEWNSYPLQYSDLENSRDCIVHGVAKSQTQLSNFHLSFTSPTRGCLNFLPSAGSQQTFGDMGVPIREDLGLWEPLCSCLVCARNQEGPKALRVTPSPGLTAAVGGQTQPGSHGGTSHSRVPAWGGLCST